MLDSSPYHSQSPRPLPLRDAATAARNKIQTRAVDQESNIFVANSDSKKGTDSHKKQITRKKHKTVSTQNPNGQIVTVNQTPTPSCLHKSIQGHFLSYHRSSDAEGHHFTVQQVLDDLQKGNHTIYEAASDSFTYFPPAKCRERPLVTAWIDSLFQEYLVQEPGAMDVVCQQKRNAPKAFLALIKAKARLSPLQQYVERVVRESTSSGFRFLQFMSRGIYFVLNESDHETQIRVSRALENHHRQKKTTSAATTTTATNTSTGVRKARPAEDSCSDTYLEDSDDGSSLLPPINPNFAHNPALSDVKVGTYVAVYWVGDQCYYGGEVTKYMEAENGEKTQFYVAYDDGQNEWVDLRKKCFMMQYRESDDDSLDDSPCGTFDEKAQVHEETVLSSGSTHDATMFSVKVCEETEDLAGLAAGKRVGFLAGLTLKSTFAQIREQIEKHQLGGLPTSWEFHIPNLGPMTSATQETLFKVGSFSIYTSGEHPRVIYIGQTQDIGH